MAASVESSRLLPLGNQNDRTPFKFPYTQLGVLLTGRITSRIAYHQISPYINQFLVDLRVAEPHNVGFYSGLIGTTYFLAQALSTYYWGYISDIVGRRPVVLIGLVGVAATTTVFGMSTSFVGMLASKFLDGFLAGNAAVIHSSLAEISDETNQDLVIPIYSLGWPVAGIIGPLIGGTLENAATRYPDYFSWKLFVEHPYLPPCLASAAFVLVGAGLSFAFMEETLRKDTIGATPPQRLPLDSHPTQREPADLSVGELLSVPAIRALAISGLALKCLGNAFDVVVILICYSEVESGGLGFDPFTIGNFLAFGSVLSVLLRVFLMPVILRNFDYAKIYNACMMCLPFAFAGLPLLNAIARYQLFGTDARSTAAVWVGLGIVLTLAKAAWLAYYVNILLIKQHAPTPSSFGQSNGIVEFAMNVGSAVGPVLVNTLFTVCNGSEWARRYGLAWSWAGVMVGLSWAGARVTKELANWS